LSTNSGWYSRIGNTVMVDIYLVWTSKGSASTALEISLPFTTSSTRWIRPCFTIGYCQGISVSGATQIIGTTVGNVNYFNLATYASGIGTPSYVLASSCSSSGQIQISGTYSV